MNIKKNKVIEVGICHVLISKEDLKKIREDAYIKGFEECQNTIKELAEKMLKNPELTKKILAKKSKKKDEL